MDLRSGDGVEGPCGSWLWGTGELPTMRLRIRRWPNFSDLQSCSEASIDTLDVRLRCYCGLLGKLPHSDSAGGGDLEEVEQRQS